MLQEKKEFDLDEYVSSMHNENGSPLSEEQQKEYKRMVKNNGLFGFDKDGLIIRVVPPEPNS